MAGGHHHCIVYTLGPGRRNLVLSDLEEVDGDGGERGGDGDGAEEVERRGLEEGASKPGRRWVRWMSGEIGQPVDGHASVAGFASCSTLRILTG